MKIILSSETLANPKSVFETRRLPKKFLGRGFQIWPKRWLTQKVFWRLVFEQSLPRYVAALIPFAAAAIIWPHLALPISQAPLLMFGVVYLIEVQFLSASTPDQRKALLDPVAAARGLDLLRVRARKILTEIAAGHPDIDKPLHLVIETSGLLRVTPLSLVSVQVEGDPRPAFLDLTSQERAIVEETLFDDDLTEDLLRLINASQNTFVRDEVLEPDSVSAHARLFAMARASGS